MDVIIWVDPHKSSHTAVALDPAGEVLGELRVTAGRKQIRELQAFAAGWPDRRWAVEGANGLDHRPGPPHRRGSANGLAPSTAPDQPRAFSDELFRRHVLEERSAITGGRSSMDRRAAAVSVSRTRRGAFARRPDLSAGLPR